MFCQTCGAQLPLEAKACPNCGTLTPAYYASSGASGSDPTRSAGSSAAAMSAPAPSTQYGSNPYEGPLQNPYYVNPYETPPPPPPPPRQNNRLGLVVGIVLVVLLLIGGGVFASFQYFSARNAPSTAPVATTVHDTTSTTATPQHFTAKGTFTIVSKTNLQTRQDGQNKISTYTQQEIDAGDVTGSLTVEETSIVYPDNTATFNGTSTCTCTIDGKSGTLVYSYTGTVAADGSYQGQDFDGHGTGGLAKLHGQGSFQGQGAHGTYSSDLYFDA